MSQTTKGDESGMVHADVRMPDRERAMSFIALPDRTGGAAKPRIGST
jgi:hypothetical protein